MEAADLYGLVSEDRLEHLQRMLAVQGLTDSAVEVRPAAPGRYQLHDETLHEDAASARTGALLGMLLGALVGWGVAVLVPQVDDLATTLGTVAALAGLAALVGAMVGLQRAERFDADPVAYREVTGDEGLVMVAVHDEHWHNRAHRILERHGAVFLQGPTPV